MRLRLANGRSYTRDSFLLFYLSLPVGLALAPAFCLLVWQPLLRASQPLGIGIVAIAVALVGVLAASVAVRARFRLARLACLARHSRLRRLRGKTKRPQLGAERANSTNLLAK